MRGRLCRTITQNMNIDMISSSGDEFESESSSWGICCLHCYTKQQNAHSSETCTSLEILMISIKQCLSELFKICVVIHILT